MQVRFVLWFASVLSLLLWSPAARAELGVQVHDVLGQDPPCAHAWHELNVTIRNPSPHLVEGSIVVAVDGAPGPWVKVPFRVAGDTQVRVQVPAHMAGDSLALTLHDAEGRHLFGPLYLPSHEPDLLLLNGTGDPRFMHAIVEGARRDPMPFEVRTSPWDKSSGDALLPERAATYACANIVLIRSDQLTTLGGKRMEALMDHVRSGGALVVAVTRASDLAHETLRALVGGEVRATPPTDLMRLDVRDPISTEKLLPGEAVDGSLASFVGGRLRPTMQGAAAPYGKGQVQLLGFDPTQSPGLQDAWVMARTRELAKHILETNRPPGADHMWDPQSPAMRRVLDPNESSRWSILVSVVLLIVFAVLAGPVTFRRCERKRHALRPFWLLPLMSVLFFGVVLIVGAIVKGWPGHARQLAFVDGASGMTRAPSVRFHALFSANAGQFSIASADSAGMIRPFQSGQSLELGRHGMRLAGVTTAPWNVVVAREDGFFDLGGGVTVVPEDGDVRIENRTGHALRAVVVVPTASEIRFFETLADGADVLASNGRPAGSLDPRRTGLPRSVVSLMNESCPALGDAWRAVESSRVAGYTDDVAVVLAMIDVPAPADTPLRLDRAHVLLRVQGEGGER